MARLPKRARPGDLEAVRSLFAEYARSVDEPRCFAGFERELAELPQGYRALFMAEEDGVAAGCVGLREVDRGTAEMKRLAKIRLARPWIGSRVAQAAIDAARSAGYARIVLDSLPKMREAQALYRSLDFRETAPYLAQPTPGASCFERRL